MRRAALALVVVARCTCGEDAGVVQGPPDSGDQPDAGNVATVCAGGPLEIAPAVANLTLDGSATTPSQTFTVAAAGSSVDTAGLAWFRSRDDDADPGTIAAGVYHPYPYAGGTVTVRARDTCGHEGVAQVQLTLAATINPPDAATQGRFAGTVVTGSGNAPTIVYPSNDTRFPRNIYKQLFQWRKNGNDSFRITFTGAGSTVQVYTDGAHSLCASATPAAGCWESDARAWSFIASSNAGQTVQVTVDGVRAADSSVYRSSTITIGFSRRDVAGAIFYWSTTAAGVRRASVSDAEPEAYVVAKPTPTTLDGGAVVGCVACHTVSRDGKKMVGGTKTNQESGLFVYDVTLDAPPNAYLREQISTQNKAFGTFSPDDSRVVAAIAGDLNEYSAADGGLLAPLPLGSLSGTHPDWSPLGQELVFATGSGDAPSGASLAVIAYQGSDTWGAIRTLAPAKGKSNLFPSYSPEGEWVAYSRGKGGHGDTTSQLFVIRADSSQGSDGIELVRANREVNSAPTLGQHENNQPTWAPPGDYHWVAFNSHRAYGVVLPNGGVQQIWVAAIDLARAEASTDPSFPAFRFSFQSLDENNHRAFWAQDVRYPDGGPCISIETPCELPDAGPAPDAGTDSGPCIPTGQTCDQTSGPGCCAPNFCDVDPANPGTFICLPLG